MKRLFLTFRGRETNREMERSKIFRILLIFAIGFAVIIVAKIPDIVNNYYAAKYEIEENEDLIYEKTSHLSSDKDKTAIDITTLVYKQKSDCFYAKIFANYYVDPYSDYGIDFMFSKGIRFTRKSVSYPEGLSEYQKQNYFQSSHSLANVWTFQSETDISLAEQVSQYGRSSIEGRGAALLEFEIDRSKLENNELKYMVYSEYIKNEFVLNLKNF